MPEIYYVENTVVNGQPPSEIASQRRWYWSLELDGWPCSGKRFVTAQQKRQMCHIRTFKTGLRDGKMCKV